MTNTDWLRRVAENLDEHGIGVGDHCDGPAVRAAADEIERLEAELRGVLGDLMRWLAFPADAQARQALARRVAAGIGGDAADVLRKLAAVAGKGGGP